jgi:hypothetical protein
MVFFFIKKKKTTAAGSDSASVASWGWVYQKKKKNLDVYWTRGSTTNNFLFLIFFNFLFCLRKTTEPRYDWEQHQSRLMAQEL